MLFIIPNNYTEDEAKSIAEKVEGVVTENGANIVFREFWGKKKLAYIIKQNHYGYCTDRKQNQHDFSLLGHFFASMALLKILLN